MSVWLTDIIPVVITDYSEGSTLRLKDLNDESYYSSLLFLGAYTSIIPLLKQRYNTIEGLKFSPII